MRDPEAWVPTKFEKDPSAGWHANRNEVPITSRLIGDIAAAAYAAAIENHASGRLADLGCGRVPLYGMYRDKVTDVACIDWPASLHGSLHIDIFADLNMPLQLEPDSFDTVIASDVIEHLHNPRALFSSSYRVLRRGGKLIIGVPFLYWIHEEPQDFHRYTRFALEKMTSDAGLVVISLASFAGAPEVLADLLIKTLASRPLLARVAYVLTRAVLSLPRVKGLSSRTREAMPMGYLLVAQKP
jgi:SAM-dependent methyltransferase